MNGAEIKELRRGIGEVRKLVYEVRGEHQDLSDRNAKHPGGAQDLGGARRILAVSDYVKLMIDVERHPEKGTLEQRIEEVSIPSPSIKQWTVVETKLAEADKLLGAGEVEVALLAFMRASQVRADLRGAVRPLRAEGHEGRRHRGRVAGAGRVRRQGSAGMAAGGSSLAVQAASPASYAFVQEGAQQLSEVDQGLRKSVDMGGLLKQSAVEGAMALFGGVTQGAFTKTLSARFGVRLAEQFRETIATRAISTTAAATAAF